MLVIKSPDTCVPRDHAYVALALRSVFENEVVSLYEVFFTCYDRQSSDIIL